MPAIFCPTTLVLKKEKKTCILLFGIGGVRKGIDARDRWSIGSACRGGGTKYFRMG